MAKRFIGTDIWGQDWFLDMPNEYKLFWNYILCECDHAGFYKVNSKTFGRMIECKINTEKALEYFNQEKSRIRIINSTTWFIEDFIFFQYGKQLNSANRLHNSVLKLLGQFEVNLRSIRGLVEDTEGVKDKDKDIYNNTNKNSSTPLRAHARETSFVPPTLEEAIEFFKKSNFDDVIAEVAWNHYNDNDWKDKNGTPVKNWKLKFKKVWFKEEHKKTPVVVSDNMPVNASGRTVKSLWRND